MRFFSSHLSSYTPSYPSTHGGGTSYNTGGGGGSTLLAWTAISSLSQRRRRSTTRINRRHQSESLSFALNAIAHPDNNYIATAAEATTQSTTTPSSSTLLSDWNPLEKDIQTWLTSSSNLLLSDATRPPSNDEIKTLQKAFALFYGTDRNVEEAVNLLTKSIESWEGTNQGGDEIAGLYRVRGDANMELFQQKRAAADYAKATELLNGPDGNKADPEEKPAARLGYGRAIRSLGMAATQQEAKQASRDYEEYFKLVSRLDDDGGDAAATAAASKFSDAIIDGIQRNPYAAWEWGMVQRVAGEYDKAAEIHRLAANAFEEIGDKPRSVISALDRGIDLAAGLDDSADAKGSSNGKKLAMVQKTLEDAITSDVNVEGRDVELLQRVVAKEGEARIALSGVLWSSKEKAGAEAQFGEACSRLDDLNADYQARENERIKKGRMPPPKIKRLGFSIDDIVGADEASCSRFKNDKYIQEKLVWPQTLQTKVNKFLTLK
jgi:tetratricopeptide (TPR) repeat protein